MLLCHILCMGLYFPGPPSRFNRSLSEDSAVFSQQNPDSRARRLIPMLHHSTKNCNNNKMKLVNDFHIHTEVSSVETGNHLHFARPCSSLEERGWHYRVMFGIFPPPAVLWMDGRTRWVSPPSCPVVLGNIDHSSWRMLEMKERMVIFRLYACLWVWVE